jgi:cytochrome b561
VGLRNTEAEYGSLAKSLHWLIAIGIFALIWLGLEQAGMERGDERAQVRFIHASIATATFALMTVRIVWRFVNAVPAHPDGMPGWQRAVSSIVHWGLYAAVFVQLSAGAMVIATTGRPLPFFGLVGIPLPVADDHDAHEWWEEVHKFAWKPVAALLVLHILGALYNHFVVRNDVVRRMTTGLR